jgi:hypothetical protein
MGGIVFIIVMRLRIGFDDASNFAMYSKTFPPFPRMMPLVNYFNGEYNLKVS